MESILILFFGMITLAYIVINHLTGEGINHAVLSTMNLGILHAGFGDYVIIIVLTFLAFIFLFVLAYIYHMRLNHVQQIKPKKIKAFLHNGFLILAFLIHPFFKDIYSLYQDFTIKQSSDFHLYYKNRLNVKY